MKEKKPVDRRKYLRFNLGIKIKCHIKKMRRGKKPSPEISGITNNISVAGICFTPLEKATDFNRWSLPLKADGGLKPPSAQTVSPVRDKSLNGVREQSSLTGFTCTQ